MIGKKKPEDIGEEKGASRLPREQRPWERILWALPFFALAFVVGVQELSSDRAWPIAALLIIGIVVAAVPKTTWKELLSNVENAQFGPIAIAVRRDTARAAEIAPESDKGEGVEGDPGKSARSMLDLKLMLEWKLVFVAKHLLTENGAATFLTIGSLKFDGYLTEAEARTAIAILGTREEELNELPRPDRDIYIEEAQKFVDSVRASVFWGQVKRVLEGKEDASDASLWREDLASAGRRHDLLAGLPSKEFRVAPAFAVDVGSGVLKKARERVKIEPTPPERGIVVVPDISKSAVMPSPSDDGPAVVKLASLRATLESV